MVVLLRQVDALTKTSTGSIPDRFAVEAGSWFVQGYVCPRRSYPSNDSQTAVFKRRRRLIHWSPKTLPHRCIETLTALAGPARRTFNDDKNCQPWFAT